MNKSKNTTSTIRPVILLMIVVFLIAGGYLLFNFYFKNSLAELSSQYDNQSIVVSGKIVKQLPLQLIQTKQFIELSEKRYREYTNQVGAVPEYYPNPVSPEDITIESTLVGDSVFISWETPDQQYYDGVEIYRSTTPQGRDTLVADVPASTTSLIDVNVETDTQYYYTLRSWRTVENEKVFSTFTDWFEITVTDVTPPLPPSNVSVERNADNPAQLVVTWDPIEDNDTVTIRVRRSQQRGTTGNVIKELEPTVTQLIDSTVESGKTYYYTVSGVDAVGNESSIRLTIAPYGNSEPFISADKQASDVLYPN